MNQPFSDLTPKNIVAELDKDIVGQGKAKRAVAIAIRNRIRRQLLDKPMSADISPKNIILIGATGVGKTEIARRLSRLMKAPFVKVEATKFTEVGYMGRDVEAVIRDLTHDGVSRVKREKGELFAKEATRKTEERILDALMAVCSVSQSPSSSLTQSSSAFANIVSSFDLSKGVDDDGNIISLSDSCFAEDCHSDDIEGDLVDSDGLTPEGDLVDSDGLTPEGDLVDSDGLTPEGDLVDSHGLTPEDDFVDSLAAHRNDLQKKLKNGELENREISLNVEDTSTPGMDMIAMGPGAEEMEIQFRSVLKGIMPSRSKKRTYKVSEARPIIMKEETENLLDMEKIIKEGIERVEQRGIVFLDELDKVAMPVERKGSGPDVSREGVQRDLLPVVEGTTVVTKYGPVQTDHILFIAAGAFHMSKPSDLIPELQGRFPIRVELEDLGVDELRRILIEPRSSLVKQYKALMAVDGLKLTFSDSAIETIAKMAYKVNNESENLGARRLHTVLEKMLEEMLFDAPDNLENPEFEVTKEFVESKLADLVGNRDLSRFIL